MPDDASSPSPPTTTHHQPRSALPSTPLRPSNWVVVLTDGDSFDVTAAYWTVDHETRWVEFKDPEHRCVFASRDALIRMIKRV